MEQFLQNFSNGLLGSRPLYVHAVCMVFALIGAYIITYIRAKKRVKTADGTPYHYNFWYMVVANAKDALFAASLSFAAFRFSNYWIDDEGKLYLYSFFLGLCFNALVLAVEKIQQKISENIAKKVDSI